MKSERNCHRSDCAVHSSRTKTLRGVLATAFEFESEKKCWVYSHLRKGIVVGDPSESKVRFSKQIQEDLREGGTPICNWNYGKLELVMRRYQTAPRSSIRIDTSAKKTVILATVSLAEKIYTSMEL